MERSYEVVVDTSILLAAIEMNIDIKSELERIIGRKFKLIVPESVFRELKLKKRGVGLKLLNAFEYEVIPSNKNADDAVLEIAINKKCIAATVDLKLRERLRKYGIPVVYIRSKKKLDVDGFIGW